MDYRSASMKLLRFLPLAGGILAIAACVPKAETPPPPPRQPAATRPAVPVPPPPPPPAADWRDTALTRGGWSYNSQTDGSQAQFGAGGEAAFTVRCDRTRRQIILSRSGATSGTAMTLRTSYAARNVPVTVSREPLARISASMSPTDPFLDGIAFSRGRFTVEAAGLPMLVIPAWPEPARVVEDCRG